MKLKHKPNDFRVRELLKDDYLSESGSHQVYHITKRKLTSIEAAEVLAEMAGIPVGEVSMAGLKDRQGVTEQYMTFSGGKPVELNTPDLKIQRVGVAKEALSSENSYGNAFEIRLRDLDPVEFRRLAAHKDVVGRLGVPNYFDEQRFGNLRHSQGWIAKDLMLGHAEKALRNLLCAESEFDAGKIGAFKAELRGAWGDWSECREIAGRFGEHHSVFDHLRKEPTDFKGAFYHISSRLRLIHLYAFQSHIWNRAVATYFARLSEDGGARVGWTIEGPQVFPDRKLAVDLSFGGTFRLPGEGLEDVTHATQRELLELALAAEGMTPEQFRIEGVSGFQLKGEDRRLFIRPRHLKIDNGRAREGMEGTSRLTFELPRGAYATLVVRGLLSRFFKGRLDLATLNPFTEEHQRPRPPQGQQGGRGPRPSWQGNRPGGQRESYGRGHSEQRSGGWQRDNRSDDRRESYGRGGGDQRSGGWQRDNRGGDRPGGYGGGGQRSGGGYQQQDNRGGDRPGGYGGGGQRSSGGYQQRDNRGGDRPGGYGGGGQRSGGGYQQRDNRGGDRPGGYGGGGQRSGGGYQQRDNRGGDRPGGYGGGGQRSGGGYQQRDNRGGDRPGGYGGGGQRSGGGYQQRDNRGGDRPGGYGGGGPRSGGGYQQRDNRGGDRPGGYGGGGQRSGGGYQQRDNRDGDRPGGYGGGGPRSGGGYQQRDNRGGDRPGGYGGGQRSSGGYQQRDNRGGDRPGGYGGGGQRSGGGYQQRDNRGGDRPGGYGGGGPRSGGGYQQRDNRGGDRPGGYGGGGQRSGGGYQQRDNRGGDRPGGYGGGGPRSGGGYQQRDNRGGDRRDDRAGERGRDQRSKKWEGANVPPPNFDKPRPKSDPTQDSSNS